MYVEMRNIYKQYGNFRASDNVSFGIEKGKLAALLGPSGSGKDNPASNDRRIGKSKCRRYLY